MKKPLLCLLLAAAMLCLCACSGGEQPATTAPDASTEASEATQTEATAATEATELTETTHVHTYTAQVIAPTCTQEGNTLHTCECGDSYKDSATAVTAHTYQETILAATCTEDGGKVFTCACGDTYKEDVQKATGHQWGDWQTVKEPTTAAEGKAERKCSQCNQTESRKIDKLIENHTHQYTEKVTTAATCTAEGVKTFTCSCGSSYTESITRKAHEYTKKTTDPTCTARGYVTAKCKNCADSYVEKYIDATGHSYKSSVTAPTCTAKGYTAYTCKTCGHSYQDQEVAANGHKMSAATCTTAEKCSVCGATGKAAQGHKWTEATCTAPKTCSVCKVTEGGVGGHSYSKWSKISDTQHQRKCSVCSNLEAAAHSWDAGKISQAVTCEAAGSMTYTCTGCNASKKETLNALGHSWKYVATANGVTTEKCSNCNKTRTVNAESHSHAAGNLETMTVAKAASKCAALGNHALEKYSGMTDVNISICLKCGYADYTSVKSIYTPQQETARFIALTKNIRDPFLYQDAIECGDTEEGAKAYVEEYRHVSDTTCINYAIRRAKEISSDYSHNGQPVNTAENIRFGGHNIGEDFQGWCNSTAHYNNMVKWAYPYVGYARYVVGDPTFETITIYSVAVFGYHDR